MDVEPTKPSARLLLDKGISLTRQRVAIADALFERCDHWSADRLLRVVNQRGAKVSKATLYNTLKLFCQRGLVREVIVNADRVFFDSNVSPHQHFYDVSRGELQDIPGELLSLAVMPTLPSGCALDGVDIVVRVRSSTAT